MRRLFIPPMQHAAMLLPLVLFGSAVAQSAARLKHVTPHVFATVREVHGLSAAIAAEHPPVHLRGVVTHISSWPNAFFFQDASGGISVENDHPTGVAQGDEIEIDGGTNPGLFAPVVHATHIRIVGRGAMPPARLFTYAELMGGSNDSTWLAIRGVVRSAKVVNQWATQVLSLSVEANGGLVTVQLAKFTAGDPRRLVDALVLMRGVCTTSFNDKRQFTGVKLNVPSMAFVDIQEPPPAAPFSLPVTPVRSLLQYDPNQRFNHRVQIAGTVTYQDPGRALYIQDGADGVLVATTDQMFVPIGARIAAIGFPSAGTYSPILREANFHPLSITAPIEPKAVGAGDLLRKNNFITAPYDAQLLRVQGQLIETTHHLNDTTWLIRTGDLHLMAVLIKHPGSPQPSELENGSLLSVAGILSVQADENNDPSLLRILLRNPDDIHVLRSASWWTPRHTLSVLEAVLAITVAITLWGAVLRRTVRKQTYMLRESEERFRRQAQQDALTGLGSRLFLQEQLQYAMQATQGTGRCLGLLMVDLDHFKQVNDTLGHHAGDELLCIVAARIRASVREGDLVARMGGDEFIVLLKDVKGPAEARTIGAKVVANIASPAQIAGRSMQISASVGVCLYPDDATSPNELFQNVDAAMYQAKAAGRNSFSMYRTVNSPIHRGESQLVAAARA